MPYLAEMTCFFLLFKVSTKFQHFIPLNMDFLTLNFGQLLHLLNNEELKNKIRNFEKQKKQVISAKYGILFNQTYIYIYILVKVG